MPVKCSRRREPPWFVPLGGSADFRLDPDDIGLKDNWYLPNSAVNRNEWRKITVPGAWEKTPFLENFGPPNPPPAAPEYDGIAFYRFEVMIPEYLRGRKCILNLGVVDDFDTTFFNGRKIGGMNAAFGPPNLHDQSRLPGAGTTDPVWANKYDHSQGRRQRRRRRYCPRQAAAGIHLRTKQNGEVRPTCRDKAYSRYSVQHRITMNNGKEREP